MNKQRLLRLLLIFLPVVAVAVACMPTSVKIFFTETKETAYCSYLQLFPESSFQVAGVLATLFASVSGGLCITYMFSKKEKLLGVICVLSALSMIIAAVPNLLQTEPKVLPNVAVPSLMLIHMILASRMSRSREEKEKNIRRL